MKKEIKYLDLFSGAGGFAKGFQLAGFTFSKHYFSEIDKFAVANYQYNFKDAKNLGDIKKIKGKGTDKIDLITFGSPCQDLSLAGKRKGLNGNRSGLFFEAVRLIRNLKPGVFVFENVKGLLSSNQGRDFIKVLKTFADLGLYDLEWQVLNTSWVLPQNRERIYVIGHLRNSGGSQVFPFIEKPGLSQTGIETGKDNQGVASALTSNYSKGVHARGETYIKSFKVTDGSKGFVIAKEGDSINLGYPKNILKSGRVGKGVAHTILTNTIEHVVKNGRIRRLMPIECERLQGFPDNWTMFGDFNGEIKELSDTQRYKLMGNAVTVTLVKEIALKLLKPFDNNKRSLSGTEIMDKEENIETEIPEVEVVFNRDISKSFLGKITSSANVADFIRSIYKSYEITTQEHFIVLFLNTANQIMGYYRHTKGTTRSTQVDLKLILGGALKCLATSIVIAHNHPTGRAVPSDQDKALTKKVKEAAGFMDITLLDHLIITTDSYYSFADDGLLGVPEKDDSKKYDAYVEASTDETLDIGLLKQKAVNLRKKMDGGLSGKYNNEVENDTLWDEWKRLRSDFSQFDVLVMEGEKLFYTYDSDVELLREKIKDIGGMEWNLPDRKYLIKGFSKVLWMHHYIPMIKEAGLTVHYISNGKPTNWNEQQKEMLDMLKRFKRGIDPDNDTSEA